MAYQSKSELIARINELENSKAAFLARVEASPASFQVIGAVTDVVRDGVLTHFTVGDNVMRVTVNAIADSVTLTPLARADQYAAVTVSLANATPEVDFTPATAAQVYATYEAFRDGPKPSGAELAAGLNRHVG